MSETQNAAFEAAYKVAYEAAMEAAQAVSGGYPDPPDVGDQDTLELSFRKIKNALRKFWILILATTLIFAILTVFSVSGQAEVSGFCQHDRPDQ